MPKTRLYQQYFFKYTFSYLTLSSIYTHFNTLKKKVEENIVKKGVIPQNEQFHIFTQRFLLNLYLKIILSSADSLNLGPSQNDVLGYGLNRDTKCFYCIEKKRKLKYFQK